jgi:hypothetical protein
MVYEVIQTQRETKKNLNVDLVLEKMNPIVAEKLEMFDTTNGELQSDLV